MAISLVGTAEGAKTTSGNMTINLPTLSQNDYSVVCAISQSSCTAPAMVTSGYTANGSTGNMRIWYKKMGATPDTTVVITPGTLSSFAWNVSAVVFCLRGVDTTTPVDATTTTATGSSTAANSPSITTVTDGSLVLSFMGLSSVADTTVTGPSGYSSQTDIDANGSLDSTCGGAYKIVSAHGAEDPGAWTNDSGAWNAASCAFRDANPSLNLQPSLVTNSQTYYQHALSFDQTLTPSLVSNSQAYYQHTVTGGVQTVVPSLVTDADTFYTAASTSAISYRGLTETPDDVTSGVATFTAVDIGTASSDRLVFVYVLGTYSDASGSAELPDVTIGGSAATFEDSGGLLDNLWSTNGGIGAAWFWRLVTSGSTADITVDAQNASETWTSCKVYVFAVTGVDTTTPVSDAQFIDAGTDPDTITVNVSDGGAVLASVLIGTGTPPQTTWTGVTEAAETTLLSNVYGFSVGYEADLAADATYDITADYTGAGSLLMYIAAFSLAALGSALTVTAGPVNLTPSLVTDGDTVYSATVASTGQALLPTLVTDGDTVYSHTVSPGAVNLTPSLVTDGDTIYSHTVTPGAVNLTPSLVTDGDTVYAATVTYTYNLTPSLVTDADTVYSHTVSTTANLAPSLVTDGDTVYSASVSTLSTVAPNLVTNSNQTYTHVITTTANIQPSLFEDGDTTYTHVVTSSATLQPSLVEDGDTYYTHVVSLGGRTLEPSLVVDGDTVYSAAVTTSNEILPSLVVDGDTIYSATVGSGGTGAGGEYILMYRRRRRS